MEKMLAAAVEKMMKSEKELNEKKEEKGMYYDAKEMAVKTLVEDFMGGKDLSKLDRDFIAFNDCLVWAKICNKYPRVTNKFDIKKTDPKCFEKRMKRAEMIDQLSLRLSVLSKLGYVNVDTFLSQYKNFFDACKAAKDLGRMAYVNHKLSLDKNINKVINLVKARPNEEYKNKFWQEYYKKMLEYANAYDKKEVIWGISNTQEIKAEAMKRIIQTLTKTNEKLSGRDFDGNDLQMIEVE